MSKTLMPTPAIIRGARGLGEATDERRSRRDSAPQKPSSSICLRATPRESRDRRRDFLHDAWGDAHVISRENTPILRHSRGGWRPHDRLSRVVEPTQSKGRHPLGTSLATCLRRRQDVPMLLDPCAYTPVGCTVSRTGLAGVLRFTSCFWRSLASPTEVRLL